jgi:hypothetical protein
MGLFVPTQVEAGDRSQEAHELILSPHACTSQPDEVSLLNGNLQGSGGNLQLQPAFCTRIPKTLAPPLLREIEHSKRLGADTFLPSPNPSPRPLSPPRGRRGALHLRPLPPALHPSPRRRRRQGSPGEARATPAAAALPLPVPGEWVGAYLSLAAVFFGRRRSGSAGGCCYDGVTATGLPGCEVLAGCSLALIWASPRWARAGSRWAWAGWAPVSRGAPWRRS